MFFNVSLHSEYKLIPYYTEGVLITIYHPPVTGDAAATTL